MYAGHNFSGHYRRHRSQPKLWHPKEFRQRYLPRLRYEDGVRGDTRMAELKEQEHLSHEAFAYCDQTSANREQYESDLRQTRTAIQSLLCAAESGVIDELKQGITIAQAAYAPFAANIFVPPTLWKFLDVDFDRAEAIGLELKFRDIRLVRFAEFKAKDRDAINQQIAQARCELEKYMEIKKEENIPRGHSADRPLYVKAEIVNPVEPDKLKQFKHGLSLDKAAERFWPDEWKKCSDNDIPIMILGSAVNEAQQSRYFEALEALRSHLYSKLDASEWELRVLHPPNHPEAVWTAVSNDVLNSVDRDSVDFIDSTLELNDGTELRVRVFPVDFKGPTPATASDFDESTQQAKSGSHEKKAQLRRELKAWLKIITRQHGTDWKKARYLQEARAKYGSGISENLFNDAWRDADLLPAVSDPGAPKKAEP